MSSQAKAMQGIVITARKPLVEQSDDKISFNVESDPAAKTESALDLLRKTPFVSVDGENNVTVNGQSNFRVLLNGRETAMFAANVKEALRSFPGAAIVKIEVITSPSAKYDGEGVGGIINIVTKKKLSGYNGSVNTWYTQVGWYNLNTNFSAKWGKVGMSLNYGAGGTLMEVLGRTRMVTIPKDQTAFTQRQLVGDRHFKNFWNFGNAEVNWELDSLRTVSFYGNVSGGWNRSRLDQDITTSYLTGPDSISQFNLNSRNEYPTNSVGADYIRKYASNKEKEFSIRLNTEFGNSNTFLNSVMDNQVMQDRYIINNSVAKNVQYTVQTDYILPLKNSQKLEGGLKMILRDAHSDFKSQQRSTPTEDYKLNRENTDFFRYKQNVYSAYGSFSFKKDKTTFRVGARVEHTTVDGDFTSASTKVEQNYTNLLPNIQASTRFSNAFTMVVNYSDRIQRPFIFNLNPFRNNNDPLNISYGNPNLDPQVIHTLSVQTRLNKGGTFAGLTFTGSYSNNMIVQYSSYDAATGVTSTTSGNFGEEIGIGVNGNFNTRITSKWSLSANGGVRYSRIKNKMMPSQIGGGYGGNANINTNYTVSKRFYLSGYWGFFRTAPAIQTTYPLNLWYGLNAGYKFFGEKLSVSLGVSNFFEKDRDFVTRTIDPAFTYTSTSTMPFRGFTFTINWSFGKLSENVSKKKGVTNDDLLGGNGN
jgi:outer membrane receptor protein involved in Fe transport